MSRATRPGDDVVEAATCEAAAAADHGRWDDVADWYRRRGEALTAQMPAAGQAQRLLTSDRAVMEKARVAKLALLQALTEIAVRRHRLGLLRELAVRLEPGGAQCDHVV